MQEAHAAIFCCAIGAADGEGGRPVGDVAALVVDVYFGSVALNWVMGTGVHKVCKAYFLEGVERFACHRASRRTFKNVFLKPVFAFFPGSTVHAPHSSF